MRRALFQGSDAPEWQGSTFSRLAQVCQAKGLTEREAQCLNCYVRGWSLRQTGELLGIRSYRQVVWRHIRAAVDKLGAASLRRPSRRLGMDGASVRTVLELIRTVDTNPRPAHYDKQGRQVSLRARILTPDDFGQNAPDFWDDLDLSLAPCRRGETEWDYANDGEEGGIDDPGATNGPQRAGDCAAVEHPPQTGRHRCSTSAAIGVERSGVRSVHGEPCSQNPSV